MKNQQLITTSKILVLISFIILFLGIGSKTFLTKDRDFSSKKNLTEIFSFSVKPVSAQEIYPIFECPCCGKPIDQCTCPMAKERRAFVDGLTSGDISEEEAIMIYAKKYGLESFIDEKKKEEFTEKLIQAAPADRPIIMVNPDSFDFDDVSQEKGVVTTFFEIENEGKSDLVIEKLETSCGCTSASIIDHGLEGPKFSMPGHGANEQIGDWQVIIPPGEKAQLKVYYDPNVHEDFRGAVTRTVSIFSSDPINFEKKVTIELDQVD